MLFPKPKKLTKEDEELIARLKQSASRPLTKQQVQAQRVSWVFGNLPNHSKLTREEIDSLIRARHGE